MAGMVTFYGHQPGDRKSPITPWVAPCFQISEVIHDSGRSKILLRPVDMHESGTTIYAWPRRMGLDTSGPENT